MELWVIAILQYTLVLRNPMRHTISLSLILAAIWLLNSGHFTPLILSLGALSVALVVYIARRMAVVDYESQPFYLTRRFPYYYIWLTIQVAKANFDVVKRIWLGPSSINPAVGQIRTNQDSDLARVIYANSITLTPGTVTVDIEGDIITVHALTEQALLELQAGEMDHQITRLEE